MNPGSTKNLTTIEEKVLRFVEDKQLLRAGNRVLAGVSGGADSVCLLFVLLSLKEYYEGNLHVEVVHVHHMIRGEEADEDMAYVEELCRQYDVPCHVVKEPVEQIAKEQGLSVEEAGRKVRYEAFERICRERSLEKVAVAHHRDDNAETILMNLFRGSGMKGVAGILAVRDRIIRPLMNLSRDEIETYLKEKGVEYRTDSTNLDCDYTRNKIRNELIPYIKENVNSNAVEHIVQFGARAQEIDYYFQKKANILFEKYGRIEENRAILCLDCLKEDKIEIMYLIRKTLTCLGNGLKDVGQDHMEQVYRLMNGRTGGQCHLPGNVQVEKSYNDCIFKNIKDSDEKTISPSEEIVDIYLSNLQENIPFTVTVLQSKFTFTVKKLKKNETFPKKKYTKWFDCDKIKFTLQLRTRKKGDYITINSSGGRKKLKDYFIDNKVPREERDKMVLLAEDSEILWIAGMRISERYKVDETTIKILEVRME